MKPRWAKVIAAAKEIKPVIQVWYHSDGNIFAILGDLIEIGITILNPVQPECMNPLEVRRFCGKRLAFDGCLGTQSTMPFGSSDDVRRTVRELVDGLDAWDGGLMLSPTHILEPEVPLENIQAFFDACADVARVAEQ
jgi:uroporphyrinogen decarboxylase